jgi:NAD(P)-dependent dehydrogenase (short-subunit alcohol dehydrogenase family)
VPGASFCWFDAQKYYGGNNMKIILIGASGTIGKGIVEVLSSDHEIIKVGHRGGDFQVDISSKDLIEKLFRYVGSFDVVISAAGMAKFGSLDEQPDEDYQLAVTNKLMGQINLVRVGRKYINDNGSFALTSGMLSYEPTPGSASISMVNSAIDGFVRAAALEMQRGMRVNAVSPVFVKETMEAMKMDSTGGMPAVKVALAYKESVEGKRNGEVLNVIDFA